MIKHLNDSNGRNEFNKNQEHELGFLEFGGVVSRKEF
jgi:hypothetical protein